MSFRQDNWGFFGWLSACHQGLPAKVHCAWAAYVDPKPRCAFRRLQIDEQRAERQRARELRSFIGAMGCVLICRETTSIPCRYGCLWVFLRSCTQGMNMPGLSRNLLSGGPFFRTRIRNQTKICDHSSLFQRCDHFKLFCICEVSMDILHKKCSTK